MQYIPWKDNSELDAKLDKLKTHYKKKFVKILSSDIKRDKNNKWGAHQGRIWSNF